VSAEPATPVTTGEPAAVVTPEPDEGQDIIPEDTNLWDDLSRDLEEPDDVEPEDLPVAEVLAEPVPEPVVPAPAETTPEAEIPAEIVPTAAETAVPVEPVVQPTPVTEPEPEPIPQQTEEEITAAQDARRSQIEETLTGRFNLTSDEALQLVTNPGEVFPKLQARMFTDMWLHVEAMIDQRLPQVIESTTRGMRVRDEKVDDFFKAWPQLDRKKHGAQVAQVAAAWASVNKGATEEEVTRNVGMQVMFMNGIAPDMTSVDQPPEAPAPETPIVPHRPAAVNGVPATPQQSSGNVYTDMSFELDEDED